MDTQLLEAPLFRHKKETYDFDIEDDVQNLFDEVPDQLMPGSDIQQESEDHDSPPVKKRLSKKLLRRNQSDSPPAAPKRKGKKLLAKSSLKKQRLSDSESDLHLTPRKSQDSRVAEHEDSFVSVKAKKVKGKKEKVSKKEQVRMKRQEKMKEWEAQFGAEEKDEPQEVKQIYFTGMEFQKEQKPVIKRANKMMNSLDLDLDAYDKEHKEDRDLVVDIKPRQVTKSIEDFKFFKKAEKLMISRQSQKQVTSSTSSYNNDDSAAKRNKQSLNKLITSSQIHQNADLDLKVNIPCFARGKSNQLLNSTLYLKRLSSLENTNLDCQSLGTTNSLPEPIITGPKKRRTMTRRELFNNISKDIRKRKSQTLTLEEIRSSFKKTDLAELDVLKKSIQDKRNKKFGPVDSDPNDSDFQMEDHVEQLERDQNLKEELNSGDQMAKIQGQLSDACKVKQEVAVGDAQQMSQDCSDQDQPDNTLLVQQSVDSGDQDHSRGQSKFADQVIQNPIDEEEYNRLLRMDEDQNSQQDMSIELQDHEQQSQDEDDHEDSNQCQSIEADDEDQDGGSEGQASEVNKELEVEPEDSNGVSGRFQDSGIKMKQQYSIIRPKNRSFLDEEDEEAEFPNNKQLSQMPTQEDNGVIHQVQQENYQSKNNSNAKMAFKNLKKMAVVISQKRKRAEEGRLKAGKYFDDEAQLGSDNEDNDFVRKIINKEEEEVEERELGEDLDQQLEDLIDNAVYLNQSDEQAAFQKFLADERLRDKQELSRVIRGEFRNNKEYDRQFQDNDGDEQARNRRMDEVYQDMRRKDEEENAYYVYNKLVEGKKNASSQSESEQNQVNPFQQELKRKLDREQTLKKSLAEPTIFKRFKAITPQTTVTEPQSDKKYSIGQQKITKRGSLMSLQPPQMKKKRSSQLQRFYHKEQAFPTTNKVFKFGGKNGAWTIHK